MTRTKLKSFAPLFAIIACIALARTTIAFAATHAQPPATADPATSLQSATSQTYSEYRNDRWHFAIVVPSNFTVGTYDRPGGVVQTLPENATSTLDILKSWEFI